MRDAGLTFVKYSLHGHTAELHDKLVAVPGAFDKNLKSIENLKKLNVGIGVNIVLNELNYRHLVEFYELFLLKLQLSNFVIIAPLYEASNMTLHAAIRALQDRRAHGPSFGVLHIKKAYDRSSPTSTTRKPPLLLHFTPMRPARL